MLFESPGLTVVETVEEGLRAKARRPEARFIAGGTEVIADQNLELLEPAPYISLRRVPELRKIAIYPDRVRLGSGVVIASLLDGAIMSSLPLLAKVARAFGTRQIRNRGTVGGNVASALPDRSLLPCLLALNATVELRSPAGGREIPLSSFLTGPGRTVIEPGELVVSVSAGCARGFQDYRMVGPRNAQFHPTVSVALAIDEPSRNVRLGLGNAGPKALRAPEAEAFAGQAIDWHRRHVSPSAAEEFGAIAAMNCAPISDATAGADYRRHAVRIMSKRLLLRIFEDEAA